MPSFSRDPLRATLTITTSAHRHFIDWQQLPLPAAARWLADQHAAAATNAHSPALDMSRSILVVPGSRSERRLLELLLDEAERQQRIFTPPQTTTIGSLPELLYVSERPLAGPLVQTLAWVEALRATPPARLREFSARIPEADDSLGWQMLAGLIGGWHTELAGNGMTFRDVLEAGESVGFFQEAARWQVLHEIQQRYLAVLNREKMWDRQTARLVAIGKDECRIDKRIFLVGTVDLNPTARNMLEQVADQVTAIVFSDPREADRFDDLGCLEIDRWEQAVIDIPDAAIQLADQPGDQAKIVSRYLAELDGEYGVDQISIGVPDPRLIPNISRSLAEASVRTHDIGGSSIGNTRPFVLLELLSGWIDDPRFENFAALVRHPDLYEWLVRRLKSDQWLGELDHYQNNRLPFFIPTRIDEIYFGGKDHRGNDRYAVLERAYRTLLGLLQPLWSPADRPLAGWSGPWKQVLLALYQESEVDRNAVESRRTIRACQEIIRSLIEMEEFGGLLAGQVSCVEAITWALDLCSESFVAEPAEPDAISLVGWLDSPWEDTPVTILSNVNDGFIPSSENSSLFLPNSIRSEMGLVDNRRRYARDAYALSLILNSRDQVLLVVGRRDEDGLPLLPSRLLMTGDRTTVAGRALRLFGDGEVTAAWPDSAASRRPTRQGFPIPRPGTEMPEINSMRVTDFKVYITCPYRFYLSRVLNMDRLSDSKDELDGGQFGSLIHDVVESFGRSEMKDSADGKKIEAWLMDCLNRFSMARYGRRAVPTVQIQLEQARMRLRAFATWQAAHRQQGFEIFEVEREKTRQEFDVDGQPFEVRGQIDRIDINHQLKRIGVYDYKTGDKGEGPRELHQTRRGEWKDLQLPLYHHLLGNFELPDDYQVETGLILLARDIRQVALFRADWSAGELAAADARAFEIMRDVRRGIFWPPTEKNIPPYWDDFAGICQSQVFEKWTPATPGGSE